MVNKPQDDTVLVAVFKNMANPNPAKSALEGRPMFDDVEVCEIRTPGSKDTKFFPAHMLSPMPIIDPYTGEQRRVTYAERFNTQYRQFKNHAQQTQSGTPLQYAPFLTEARRMELRALSVYTVESLAQLDGQELKNIGLNGRELKNQAQAYLEKSHERAIDTRAMAELEALRAKMQTLEEDNAALKLKAQAAANGESMFDEMTLEQLRDYIVSHNNGQPLHGTMNRKTLVRMALDLHAAVKAA